MPDNTRVNVEKHTLEKMRMALFAQIAPELAEHFAIEPEVDISASTAWFSDLITVRVVQSVYGREVKEKVVKYPANWWEAIKERFFPKWLLKKYPIKYTRIEMTAREVYPLLLMPDKSPQVVIGTVPHCE